MYGVSERMATKEELLSVMREYGVKEYYTMDYELGVNLVV